MTPMLKTVQKKIRKAVFPVAGLGTRFLPATKVMPKEMLVLGDKPLIQHAYEEARDAGIEEFILVTSDGKKVLEDHFRHAKELVRALEHLKKIEMIESLRGSDIAEGNLFTVRQEKPLGLGHAVLCARKFVGDEPFAVILPDDVILGDKGCLSQMVEAYGTVGGNLVSVINVPREDTRKYGILDIGYDDGALVDVRGLVEKPEPALAPSTLSIVGRYILQPEIFDFLAESSKGQGGEIQLTDSMAKLIGRQPFHGLRFEGMRFDCGSRLGLAEATVAYTLANVSIGGRFRTSLEAMLRA